MNIKETFLKLTSETYPHGYESEMFHLLPNTLETDPFGNLFLQIGKSPSTMFTSHLDTASHEKKKVNHIIQENIIKTDGTSILGADDKAGVTIMLYMIENKVPGLYYFFLGEERGCIGSKKVADSHRKNPIPYIKKVISFDRRGNDSIITFQSSQRCCSDMFADRLSETLNIKSKKESTIGESFEYRKDPTGIYTDSYQFISIYPECTNISVGYQNEHTSRETQDIVHLEKLAKTCILIDWENLPVERDPKIVELDETDRYITKMWNYDYKPKKSQTKKIWFVDNDYDKYVSYVEVDENYRIINVDISSKRVLEEKKLIYNTLRRNELEFQSIDWNGKTLTIYYEDETENTYKRNDIEEFVTELSFWTQYIN